jgi:nitrogen fixation/metabolism regulation signal transduction histidine kinase
MEERGHVVVFDDITTLLAAQRDAAWGVVARRLAHEIKNPLTPIQLSAERLRHKLLAKSPEEDARIVDRATRTIIQQVEAMKSMVNDFSEYARSPRIQTEPVELDRLVQEVLDLYRSAGAGALGIRLGAPGAMVRGDPLRLRQVIHNLIKNAQEALEGRADPHIEVTTLHPPGTGAGDADDQEGDAVELQVRDNGPGFDGDLKDRAFEPYVTTKPKGTGLGLAIVKKIIEEHGGMIAAENTGSGAAIRVRLPVWKTGPSAAARDGGQDGSHKAHL